MNKKMIRGILVATTVMGVMTTNVFAGEVSQGSEIQVDTPDTENEVVLPTIEETPEVETSQEEMPELELPQEGVDIPTILPIFPDEEADMPTILPIFPDEETDVPTILPIFPDEEADIPMTLPSFDETISLPTFTENTMSIDRMKADELLEKLEEIKVKVLQDGITLTEVEVIKVELEEIQTDMYMVASLEVREQVEVQLQEVVTIVEEVIAVLENQEMLHGLEFVSEKINTLNR